MKRILRVPRLVFVALAAVLLLGPAFVPSLLTAGSVRMTQAPNFVVFGPRDYSRAGSQPVLVTDNFSVANPNTIYTIRIYNGGQNNQFQAIRGDGSVRLNGNEIAGPRDFQPAVPFIEKQVILLASNQLAVEFSGAPGSGITLEILGLDNDVPTITATASPPRNTREWHTSVVTVAFECSDQTSGIASCPAPVQVTTEGANQVVSGVAADRSGNTASVSIRLDVDLTAPVASAHVFPTPNAQGWNNTDSIVIFTCQDIVSGIETCPAPILVTTEGANQAVNGLARNRAGLESTPVAQLSLDKTPPSLSITSPATEAAVTTSPLTISGTVSDALSGIQDVSCQRQSAILSGATFTCSVALTEGENTIEVRAVDRAGNPTVATLVVAYQAPYLELAFARQFELIWNDRGSGADLDGSFWKPVLPAGFYALGHYAQVGWHYPNGFLMVARELRPGALAQPIDYVQVWTDRGSGADEDVSVWKGVPPDGYQCLGHVAQQGYSRPSLDVVRCVREDLLSAGRPGRAFWNDRGSGANADIGTWELIPADRNGFQLGTFVGSGSFNSPPTELLYVVAGQAVRQSDFTTLTRQDIEALIQRFGPIIRHHPNEQFLMDDPVTLLDLHPPLRWGLVNMNYETYSEATLGETLTTAATVKQDEANARTHPQASDPLFRTWLHLDDNLTPGTMARSKAIVHVRKTSTGFLDLQFWLFYPFNGPGRFRVTVGDVINEDIYLAEPGRHYGDWEYVTVRLAYDVLNPSDPWRPLALFMSQHASGQWINANDSRLEYQATHPILYSAYFSHALYPTAGRHYYLRPFSVDIIVGTIAVDLFDLTGNGATIDTSQPNKYAWVASNLPHLGISQPTWLDYAGRWGQTEKLDATIVIDIPAYGDYRLPVFEEIGTGPSGPAQKAAWKNGD